MSAIAQHYAEALSVARELRMAPYDGRTPTVVAAGYTDAVGAVTAVLGERRIAVGLDKVAPARFAIRNDVHGTHVDDDALVAAVAHPTGVFDPALIVELSVASYITEDPLRSIVSHAVALVREALDDAEDALWRQGRSAHVSDIVVVVSHRPEGE